MCFHQCCILGMFWRCTVFLYKVLYWNCISTLWRSRLGCQDFKTTDPHPGVFSFSLPLKASGLNELEHKWANNSHILCADTTAVYLHISKFISSGFPIALASTWSDPEPLNFHWLQRGELSGPLWSHREHQIPPALGGSLTSICSTQQTWLLEKYCTRSLSYEMLTLTPLSYCTWKQLGQKDTGFQILLYQHA